MLELLICGHFELRLTLEQLAEVFQILEPNFRGLKLLFLLEQSLQEREPWSLLFDFQQLTQSPFCSHYIILIPRLFQELIDQSLQELISFVELCLCQDAYQ